MDDSGRVSQQVILTPPLDTEDAARQYADWYQTEGNMVALCVQAKMTASLIGSIPMQFSVVVFETTLY